SLSFSLFFFFFNDTATTEIYTLSLHDALPTSLTPCRASPPNGLPGHVTTSRSEEHTSELQSHHDLVCRLLLEKKKKKTIVISVQIKKKQIKQINKKKIHK